MKQTPRTPSHDFSLRHRRMMIAALSLMIISAPCGLHADTVTWSANATSTDWALGSNWEGGSAPVAGDDVIVSGGHPFSPTNNSSYVGVVLNSLTLTGSSNLNITHPLQVGAGGIWNNMSANSLTLNDVHLAADQTWGGTRTIFSTGVITGGALTVDVNTSVRFERNSPAWDGGLIVRSGANMNSSSFAAGQTITPFGTGTITLVNQRLSGNASNPSLSLASREDNRSLATANTLANHIVLQSPSATSGNLSILQSQDAAAQADGHFYILSGNISGAVSPSRALIFGNSRSGTAATFVLTGTNSYSAITRVNAATTLQIGNDTASGTLGTGAVENSGTLVFQRSDRYLVTNDISGSGGIQQNGLGSTLLTGSLTHSGDTSISRGGLFVQGIHSGAGAYHVSGTLGGEGKIALTEGKTITFANGSRLVAGEDEGSFGSLTLDGGGTSGIVAHFQAGAALLFHLDATTEQSSSIALTNGAAGDIVFAGNRIDFNLMAGTLVAGQSYSLFQAGDSSYFAGLSVDSSGIIIGGLELGSGLGNLSGRLTLDDGEIVLQVIPEPGAFALLGVTLGGLAFFQRRRTGALANQSSPIFQGVKDHLFERLKKGYI